MRRLLPLLVLPWLACTGEIIKPASVEICLVSHISPGPNIRIAAYWLSENPEAATDERLTDGCLMVPEPRHPERLLDSDGESEYLQQLNPEVATIITHTPLLFTYDDRNGDEQFTPISAGGVPADDVLEVVTERWTNHITWIAHFQRLVAGLRVGSGEYASLTAIQPEPGLPFIYFNHEQISSAPPRETSPVDPWCQITPKLLSCGPLIGAQSTGGWGHDEPNRVWVANTVPESIRTTDDHLDLDYPSVDRFAPDPSWDVHETFLECWLTDTVAIAHQLIRIRYTPEITRTDDFAEEMRCQCMSQTVITVVAVPADARPPWWPCDHQPDPDADPDQIALQLQDLSRTLGLDLSE